MKNTNKSKVGKIKQSEHILTLKVKTESNGLGALKTLMVFFLIAVQACFLILSYLYFLTAFQWFLMFSIILTLITCIYVLSSDYHGQAKATWILFLLVFFSFGYVIYLLSDKRICFAKSKRKYDKILKQSANLQKQEDLQNVPNEIKINCKYLYNTGKFVASTSSNSKYYPSGAQLFDEIIEQIKKAKEFIFIEFFIVSDGVLLKRMLDVLEEKVKSGVDVRIIYDDMGSHGTLKRKTKKKIISLGIKLQTFNRLVPLFNIALNLRNHRKIVVVDGKVAFTGGTNLADEYINEKRMHGYWKDCGIKIEGRAVDNFTISFLNQWKFLTKHAVEFEKYLNKAEEFETNSTIVPFVTGPNYSHSIAQNMYANLISSAKERLFIITPYFVPDETITNLLINKAKSGVDIRIVLPDIADKKFVYIVSRNNAEKLINHGVKVFVMKHSFVHSKVVLSDNTAIVGSINMDLRSFNQQFESAVYLNQKTTIEEINSDFEKTFAYCEEITTKNMNRKRLTFRIVAGLFNIISTFM